MDYHDKKISKKLSWLLRHGAAEAGIEMDPAGWVEVDAVLAYLRLSPEVLRGIVETNTKQRLQLEASKIRACQGHSLEGTAVTLEALERSWTPFTGPRLWHGTSLDAALVIAREGIEARQRTHVHCTSTPDSNVGKRANVAVLLGIDAARLHEQGYPPFAASNGVVLVRFVPAQCVVEVTACTARAREATKLLRDAFPGAS